MSGLSVNTGTNLGDEPNLGFCTSVYNPTTALSVACAERTSERQRRNTFNPVIM